MGLSDLFGDEGDRDAAMAAAFRQFKSEMTGYLAEFEGRFDDIIGQVTADRDTDLAAFEEGYRNAINNYQESVIDRLSSGFTEARGLMEEGFDQTLQDIARSSEAQTLRSMAQGSLTGLGATSFGQAQTEAIRQEGDREMRRADEAFRREYSNLVLGETSALAEAGSRMTDLQIGQTTGMSDLRRSYTAAISGLQTSLAQGMLKGQGQIAQAGYDTGMARAQNIGSGFNLGSVLVGAGASALTGGLAGGLGAIMPGMGGNFFKGMSATMMGGGGDYFKSLVQD